mmetsp:Transcript_22686/g.47638  ORF Transcript_22686/g.47638 Transcript_22686/m.47638 type:complete len:83 (-) Transcript_22686:44-292(-)
MAPLPGCNLITAVSLTNLSLTHHQLQDRMIALESVSAFHWQIMLQSAPRQESWAPCHRMCIPPVLKKQNLYESANITAGLGS